MTIRDYRATLGWSLAELARRAGLTYQTVSRVERGEPAYLHTVGAIARAISEGLHKTITVNDLDGVDIID